MDIPVLKMNNICKSFPGVKALDNVKLELNKGTVLGVLGENGAGKSTLMKILGGVYKKDSGEILYDGRQIEILGPKHAQQLGIAFIHQELNLIPGLTIMENIFLGREPVQKFTKMIDRPRLYEESKKYLNILGMDLNPKTLVKNLSVGEQQMVEIAKALSLDARIIIMDEPTGTLTTKETRKLFGVINSLREKDKSIVYISHRLEEIFEICDLVTILRDGKHIKTEKVENLDTQKLIHMMVGRSLEEKFPRRIVQPGNEAARFENLSIKGILHNVSFSVREGEVLGISGLMGSGRTELAKAIFGALKLDSGEIILDGKRVRIRSPKDAVRCRIAYLSEDRKSEGLHLKMSVKHNITLASLKSIDTLWGISKNKENKTVSDFIKKLAIKTPSPVQKVKNLSGGNQQKVAISKWMMINPRLLILDEPTRGVDVSAKVEIYELINSLKEDGVAIIMISSEMPEVIGISDRILVVHEGRIKGEFSHDEVTQEKIMACAVGMAGG